MRRARRAGAAVVELPGVARRQQPDAAHRDEPGAVVEQALNRRRRRVVVLRVLRRHHVRRAADRQDHRRQCAPAFAAARQALLTGVGDGARHRGVGAALPAGVVDVGAQRRTASRRLPRAALLSANVEEVCVDRDRRLAERLPCLQRGVDLGGLPQSFAGARPRITFAAGLIAGMRIDEQSRRKPLRGGLDDHQVAAVAHLVPAAARVEHRARVRRRRSCRRGRSRGCWRWRRPTIRGRRRRGRSGRRPSSPPQRTTRAPRHDATNRRKFAGGIGTVAPLLRQLEQDNNNHRRHTVNFA